MFKSKITNPQISTQLPFNIFIYLYLFLYLSISHIELRLLYKPDIVPNLLFFVKYRWKVRTFSLLFCQARSVRVCMLVILNSESQNEGEKYTLWCKQSRKQER